MKQSVSIMLDKERNLRYGFKAIIYIEDKLKTPISKLDMNSLTFEQLAVMLTAGLKHEDKELTVDSMIDILDDINDITEAIKAMGEALSCAFGKNAQTPNLPENIQK